jgi:uncharacterized membrane protein YhaH (DUF805 family)
MMIAGPICLGFVWGWLLARRLHGARWPAVLQLLAGLVAQGAVVAALLQPIGVIWFVLGVASGAFIAAMLVRQWQQRSM